MKQICFYVFVLKLVSIQSFAQVSINDFLKSANEDEKVKSLQQQVSFLEQGSYRLSPLQKFEVRFQNRELNTHLQQYALRFTPANPWEVRNNSRYFSSLTASLVLENELALKEALLDRYYCAISYSYYAELRMLLREANRLINDQIGVLEKQSGSSFFDADEYLDLQIDLVDAGVELEQTDLEILTTANRAEELSGTLITDSLDWSFTSLISIAALDAVVDSITSLRAISLLQSYQQQKIELASSAYNLEKSNINLGFVQTEFDRRRYEQDRTPINLSFGVTIPLTNPNKGDMAKKRLNMIEAEHDLNAIKKKHNTKDEIIQQKLTRLLLRYQELETKMRTLENGTLAQTLSTIKGGDPRVVIRFNQNKIKIKILLAKIHRDILFTYVDYLDFCDRLQQKPLTNFLSPRLSAIR